MSAACPSAHILCTAVHAVYRCLSKYGLEVHIAHCAEKGPFGPKRRKKQTDVDLVAEVSRLQFRKVADLTTDHDSDDDDAGNAGAPGDVAGHDVYVLCEGKVRLALPHPPQLPRGWAVRKAGTVTHKTAQQALFLLEEFLKNKAQGRHARVNDVTLLQHLSTIGPELTSAQLKTYFRDLQKVWNASGDGMSTELQAAKAKVLLCARAVAQESHADQLSSLVGMQTGAD